MPDMVCPACRSNLSHTHSLEDPLWLDDPILTPHGLAGEAYTGNTVVTPFQLQQVQIYYTYIMGLLGITVPAWIDDAYASHNYITQLRVCIELVLSANGMTIANYFSSDKYGITYTSTQVDWTDVDRTTGIPVLPIGITIKGIHLEELRRGILIIIGWKERFIPGTQYYCPTYFHWIGLVSDLINGQYCPECKELESPEDTIALAFPALDDEYNKENMTVGEYEDHYQLWTIGDELVPGHYSGLYGDTHWTGHVEVYAFGYSGRIPDKASVHSTLVEDGMLKETVSLTAECGGVGGSYGIDMVYKSMYLTGGGASDWLSNQATLELIGVASSGSGSYGAHGFYLSSFVISIPVSYKIRTLTGISELGVKSWSEVTMAFTVYFSKIDQANTTIALPHSSDYWILVGDDMHKGSTTITKWYPAEDCELRLLDIINYIQGTSYTDIEPTTIGQNYLYKVKSGCTAIEHYDKFEVAVRGQYTDYSSYPYVVVPSEPPYSGSYSSSFTINDIIVH